MIEEGEKKLVLLSDGSAGMMELWPTCGASTRASLRHFDAEPTEWAVPARAGPILTIRRHQLGTFNSSMFEFVSVLVLLVTLLIYLLMPFDSVLTGNMGDIMNRSDLKSMVPQPKPYKKEPYTVEASGYKKVEGETIPRRHPSAKDGLISTPSKEINTIYDILRTSSKKFGNAKALGYRKLVQTHDEVKQIKKVVDGKETTQDKKWTYFELSPYNYISFVEYEQLCLKIASGYRALGMNKGDRVHIFAATSPWWLTIAHGK